MRGRHGRGWRWRGSSQGVARFVEPALLLELRTGPAHGYTLLDRLKESGMGDLNPSAVYRILRDMETQGWIQSDWDAEETQGPPRRVYAITSHGKEVLASWVKDLGATRGLIDQLIANYIRQLEGEQSNTS